MIEINYLEIDSRELMPNINEVALRLHMPRERVNPMSYMESSVFNFCSLFQ